MTPEIVVVLSVLLVMFACIAFFYLRRYEKIKELNAKVTSEYANDYAKQNQDLRKMKVRVLELENGVNETFGVSIRQEITKVECIFDKVEMAFLMAGVFKLLNDKTATIDDKEYYIKLYKKIQKNIDQMEDPQDES